MTDPSIATTVFNPHLLSRDALIAAFSARRALLDELVDDLKRGGGQHHLLVGGRGSGKTTLLLRLAIEIEEDVKLKRRTVALRFPEEQYNIAQPSDFWINCLDALADALERRGDRKQGAEIERAAGELEGLGEEVRARRAFELLVTWARRHRKLVVLLIDNLDMVLHRLERFQWSIREALAADNGLVLIGATSRLLDDVIAYDSPLYDFFHVHELAQLSETEARELVLQLARISGSDRVATILDQDPGRFKALYTLTGGTPRTLAMLHSVLAADGASIERDLEGLLDRMTPYYKARFDELTSQNQIIVNAVALHWHPITAAECAQRAQLGINLVSSQLNRLVKAGILSKVALEGSARLGFLVSERFFNIWYLMRAGRRLRQRLIWFVEFLRVCFGEEVLHQRAQVLVQKAGNSPAQLLAYASALTDPVLRRRLEFRAIEVLLSSNVKASELRELLDLEGEDAHLGNVLERARTLASLHARIVKSKRRLPRDVNATQFADAVTGNVAFSISFKSAAVKALEDGLLSRRMIDFLIEECSSERQTVGERLRDAVSRGEISSAADMTVDEVSEFIRLCSQPAKAVAALMLAVSLMDDPERESAISRRVIESGDDGVAAVRISASSAISKGNLTKADRLTRLVLQHSTEPMGWMEFTGLYSAYIESNHAAHLLALFEQTGTVEQYLPLVEALKVASGKFTDVSHLAPEMAMAVTAILEWLRHIRTGSDAVEAFLKPKSAVGRRRRGAAPT